MADLQAPRELVRGLNAADATGLVVGTVIGTGIFLKTAIITQLVATPLLVLAAWIVAGLLSLAGALTYAELGAMLPKTGGEYVFLRAAYGNATAFEFGWMRVIVGASATAAVASAFGAFSGSLFVVGGRWLAADYTLLGRTVHWELGARQLIALSAIAAVAIINAIGVRVGGRTQTVLATVKALAVAFIMVGLLVAARTGSWGHFAESASLDVAGRPALGGAAAFGAAVVAAMWAYTGWSYLPIASGEIRNAERNVPIAITGGIIVVIVLYLGINVAYFYALTPTAIATANSTAFPTAAPVATKAIATALGGDASRIVNVIFAVSALGTLNGSMLTTPRVPFAMARDGQFFSVFARLGQRSRVPTFAIVLNAVMAGLLTVSGTYDQLTDLTVFSYAIFYALAAASVFVLRRTMPDAPRPYRTFGYPWVPLAFVLASVALVVNMIHTSPIEASLGLAVLACGIPAYLAFRRRATRASSYITR